MFKTTSKTYAYRQIRKQINNSLLLSDIDFQANTSISTIAKDNIQVLDMRETEFYNVSDNKSYDCDLPTSINQDMNMNGCSRVMDNDKADMDTVSNSELLWELSCDEQSNNLHKFTSDESGDDSPKVNTEEKTSENVGSIDLEAQNFLKIGPSNITLLTWL